MWCVRPGLPASAAPADQVTAVADLLTQSVPVPQGPAPATGGAAEIGDLAAADAGVGVVCRHRGCVVRVVRGGAGRGRGGNMVISGS